MGIKSNFWVLQHGGPSSRAVLDGKVFKRCVVCALAGSFYDIVNHSLTGITDDVL